VRRWPHWRGGDRAVVDQRSAVRREDQLFGGGRFVFDFARPNEFVLPEFSVQAEGRNGRNSSGTRFYGTPTCRRRQCDLDPCLEVDGPNAVIAGNDQFGNPTLQYFDDRSTAGKAPSDRITPVLFPTPEDVAQFMPKHFPRVCPSTTVPEEWNPAYFWTTLESGDIAVVDGGS
jgi:hypothetical protein